MRFSEESKMVTPRQKEVYDYICRFVDAYGHAPTIAQIQLHFGLKAPSSVHQLLSALDREGLIKRIPNVSRGIEIVRREDDSAQSEVPLLGVVAAGQPIEAVLTNETVPVPQDMIGRGRTFALRVRGDSMIGEQISEGDYIIVESRQTAENGQTVVALIDGSDATVKRFYIEPDAVRLEAANPKYKPIIIKPPNRVAIQGIVVGVIRKYG
jgi:repressor LexA